jgi:WD40 repeat protein
MSVAFSPDGKILAAGGFGGELLSVGGGLILFDVTEGRLIGEPRSIAQGDVRGVAFSPDGTTLAAEYSARPLTAG